MGQFLNQKMMSWIENTKYFMFYTESSEPMFQHCWKKHLGKKKSKILQHFQFPPPPIVLSWLKVFPEFDWNSEIVLIHLKLKILANFTLLEIFCPNQLDTELDSFYTDP